MNLAEDLSTPLNLPPPPIHYNETTAKWRSSKGILRLLLPVAIAAAICSSFASPVLAKSGHLATRVLSPEAAERPLGSTNVTVDPRY
jgi:hypothetical protein